MRRFRLYLLSNCETCVQVTQVSETDMKNIKLESESKIMLVTVSYYEMCKNSSVQSSVQSTHFCNM